MYHAYTLYTNFGQDHAKDCCPQSYQTHTELKKSSLWIVFFFRYLFATSRFVH